MKTGDEDALRRRIEAEGEALIRDRDAVHVDVDLKSERLTIRFSVEEVRAIDAACEKLGVGRSTLIRMGLRRALNLPPGGTEYAPLPDHAGWSAWTVREMADAIPGPLGPALTDYAGSHGLSVATSVAVLASLGLECLTGETRPLLGLPVSVSVELGRVTVPSEDMAELGPDDIITLETPVDSPLTMRVLGRSAYLVSPGIVGEHWALRVDRSLDPQASSGPEDADTIVVELARFTRPLRELVALVPGSMLELDQPATTPARLMAGDRVLAAAEVVVIDDCFGARILTREAVNKRKGTRVPGASPTASRNTGRAPSPPPFPAFGPAGRSGPTAPRRPRR